MNINVILEFRGKIDIYIFKNKNIYKSNNNNL